MVAPVTLANPYAIYERARAFWDGATYAPAVSYGITVSVTRGAKVSAAHYHAWYDARTDRVVVNAASDQERAAPYMPHGVGTAFQLTWYKHRSKPLPVSEPDRTFDYLGVPMPAPNYAFGLRSVAPNVAGGSGGSNEVTALKTIASVDVVKR